MSLIVLTSIFILAVLGVVAGLVWKRRRQEVQLHDVLRSNMIKIKIASPR